MLDFVENKVFATARPEGGNGGLGYSVSLRKAVEAALPFVSGSFADQPLIEARLRMTLQKSFQELGEYKIAAEQAQAALGIYTKHRGHDHPDTLAAMHGLADSLLHLDQYADALKLQQQVLDQRRTILAHVWGDRALRAGVAGGILACFPGFLEGSACCFFEGRSDNMNQGNF